MRCSTVQLAELVSSSTTSTVIALVIASPPRNNGKPNVPDHANVYHFLRPSRTRGGRDQEKRQTKGARHHHHDLLQSRCFHVTVTVSGNVISLHAHDKCTVRNCNSRAGDPSSRPFFTPDDKPTRIWSGRVCFLF